MSARTDKDLLLLTRRGDAPAARELWERLSPRLMSLATMMLARHGSEHAARDAVQTVFVSIMQQSFAALDRVQDVSAFLARSVRNTALNQIREHHRRAGRESAHTPQADRAATPDLQELLIGIHALPEHEREILILRHGGGLTFDQIALALDQPRGTVSTRYRTALERLRAILNHEPDRSPPLTTPFAPNSPHRPESHEH